MLQPNLVPSYYVEMLENCLKTQHFQLYQLLQEGSDITEASIQAPLPKNALLPFIYFYLNKGAKDTQFLFSLLAQLCEALRKLESLVNEGPFALMYICAAVLKFDNNITYDLVILTRLHNPEGFRTISPLIHQHLRNSQNPRATSLLLEIFLKHHAEELAQLEAPFEEDFIWQLPSIEGVYEKLTITEEPYTKLIQLSAYIRSLEYYELPCPLCPDVVRPPSLQGKVANIYKRLLKLRHVNQRLRECYKLFRYCLIEIEAFQILVLDDCLEDDLPLIKKKFVEAALSTEKHLTAEQLELYKRLEITDIEFIRKVYREHSEMFEINPLIYDEEILKILVTSFQKISKKDYILDQLLERNDAQSIRILALLHINNAIPDLQVGRIGDLRQFFDVANFIFFDYFDRICISEDYNHLCECLKLTGICIMRSDLSIEEVSKKHLSQLLKICLESDIKESQKMFILNLLLNIATCYEYFKFEREHFYHEDEYQEILELPQLDVEVTIKVPYFLELLVIMIFETNVSVEIRQFYLGFLSKIVSNLENVLILEQTQLIDKLILYLRIETQLQHLIIEILTHSMKIKFSLSYLQAITHFMSPYLSILLVPFIEDRQRFENYQKIANLLGVSKKAIQCSSSSQYQKYHALVGDRELFLKNLGLLLDCLGKVVLYQNDTYFYWLGRQSYIKISSQKFIPLETQGNSFCIVTHLNFTQKKCYFMEFSSQEYDFSIYFEADPMTLVFKLKKHGQERLAQFFASNQDLFLVINYKNNRFSVNINGSDVPPLRHDSFDFVLTQLSQISIGATHEGEYCFQGETKFLYLIDQVDSPEDLFTMYTVKCLKNGSIFSQMLRMQMKERLVAYLNSGYFKERKREKIDTSKLVQTVETELLEMSEKRDSYFIIRSRKRMKPTFQQILSIFGQDRKSLQQQNSIIDQEKVYIEAKNVLFQECTTLLDVLKACGNLDILFFPLHLLPKCDYIIVKLVELLTTIMDKYGDDNSIQTYLRSDGQAQGLDVLSYLLAVYMKNYGCSLELASTIIRFYLSIVRPQCQILQILRNNAFSIFYRFEYWQRCDYQVLQLLYSTLFEQLCNFEDFFNYFKQNQLLNQLYYVLTVQLGVYDSKRGDLRIYLNSRYFIIRSIIQLMYAPFCNITHGSTYPEQIELKEKEKPKSEQLFEFKSELLQLLNNLKAGQIYDYLKLLNFCFKKPQQSLILELMHEEKKKIALQREGSGSQRLIDAMQTQFALGLKAEQYDDFSGQQILNKIQMVVYGLITETILKQQSRMLRVDLYEFGDQQPPIFDLFMGLLTEVVVKVQIVMINFETAFIEQAQNKQNQQLIRQKEAQIIRQLLQNLGNLYDPQLQLGVRTYQIVINLAMTIFKKNLSMEKEILDFFVPRFPYMSQQSKEVVVEFFLQCSQQQLFMSQLCLHKDILEFIRALITGQNVTRGLKEKGQTLTNYIVLHHIEQVKYSARKIMRFFHYVNSFELQNHMFMSVILTILILQNTQSKHLPALVDLFMMLPVALQVYPDMVDSNPEVFLKLFSEYITYLERQQLLYSYYPDTEYVGFYQYASHEFGGRLLQENENKFLICNGGVLGTVLYVLFFSLEKLINSKEGKPLLLIWRKIILRGVQSEDPVGKYEGPAIIENEEIQKFQVKQKKMKVKTQKSSLMKKLKQSVLGQYVETQYDKYFADIHLMHLLKLQLLTQQHGDLLYDIFTQIPFRGENYLEFSFIYNELDQLNKLNTRFNISPEWTLETVAKVIEEIIGNFNTQNVLIKNALAKSGKPSEEWRKFLDQVQRATSAVKYLELQKDPELIKKATLYMKMYSYRQLNFCIQLNSLIQFYELQEKVKDIIQLQKNVEQTQAMQNPYDLLPEFAIMANYYFNVERLEYRDILQKFENEKRISQLIIQWKAKRHYKENTDKRGLWYFMNSGDGDLYEKLNNFNEDYESFLELLQKQRYQINSYEDKFRRRMFLKVFAKHKKNYESIFYQVTAKQACCEVFENASISIQNLKLYCDQKKINRQSIDLSAIQVDSIKLSILAELVTPRGFYRGKLRITNDYVMFENYGESAVPSDAVYKFQKDSLLKDDKQKVIPINSIKDVFPRGYLLQQTAVELFTNRNKTYLFNVFQNQQTVLRVLSQFANIRCVQNPVEAFKKGGFTERWKKGELTNFQYIMEINKYAGRTYNDLNQYPIFPWVIANYQEFDQNCKDHYRRLELPVGALNPKRLEGFLERFKQSTPDDANTYFMYGTHYSHSAIVLSYLMRMEPFASLHQELQSGKFDRADRLFHSLEQQWYSITNSSSDVKELIPEFFYFPEFLKNKNKFDLGQLQSGTVVSDVFLPPYVITRTPEQFVFINHLALESDYVAKSLHQWIDLIFGIKSGTHQLAVQSNNLFHKLTYAHCVQPLLQQAEDDITREQYITQVYYYGQTPMQLFKKDHQQREVKGVEPPTLNFSMVNLPAASEKAVIQMLCNEKYLVLVCDGCEISSFNMEAKLVTMKSKELGFFAKIQLHLGDNLYGKFAIYDENLAVGGFADNTLKIYGLKDFKVTCTLQFHNKIITSLALCGTLLLCGSMDTRISAWEWEQQSLKHEPLFVVYGHKKELSVMAVNEQLEILASMDIGGDILIHTLKGVFLKWIETKGEIYQMVIHPMGYLVVHKLKKLQIYTLNGDLYVDREFFENIIGLDVINGLHPDILITTIEGSILTSSIIPLRIQENTDRTIKHFFRVEDMDVKVENQTRRFRDQKNKEFLNSSLTSMLYLGTRAKILLIGYSNGQVVALF